MGHKIKVLVVDDSAVIRKILSHMINSTADMEVVGTAEDPFQARDLLVKLNPDIMTLDLEMPKMDGLTFLGKVMQHFPVRTIVVTGAAKNGSSAALKALELGAIDFVEKPTFDGNSFQSDNNKLLIEKIRIAAKSNLNEVTIASKSYQVAQSSPKNLKISNHVICIASSTGGTEALKVLLNGFKEVTPAIIITQHMPAGFTKAFADGLNKAYPFEVKEAAEGDKVQPGRVLIAPGNFHMEIKKVGLNIITTLHQQPPMHSVRPAADYMFNSVAKTLGSQAVGVVLTGMGKDGAKGLLEMKNAGSYNIGQSEKTCVVYGMPQAAAQLNALHQVSDLKDISNEILKFMSKLNNKVAG